MNSELKRERFESRPVAKNIFFFVEELPVAQQHNTWIFAEVTFACMSFLVFPVEVFCGGKLHNSIIDLYFRLSSISLQHTYKRTQPVYAITDKTDIKQSETELSNEIVENCNETGGEGYVCAITKYNFYCYCAVCTLQI